MKKLLVILPLVLLVAAIVGGFVYLIRHKESIPKDLMKGTAYAIVSREHIAIGASHDPYNSNPPSSGPHYLQPADFGFYATPIPDEQAVHNLEHGGIWITYKGVDDRTVEQLKALSRQYPNSVLISPRESNDHPLSLVSWGYVQHLESYDGSAINDFIGTNVGHGPEDIVH